ncbi:MULTISPECIES: YigZ family protein [unclassified Shewanella]|uniref:YigZ family protein n=1 Tax=unclassified Shewanella TaxID=196818 RepID=UPI001BC1F9D1|nr:MULTISPECIES: YigZ family protein [unclassified Shewanella]GIU17414.1 YigZ family protein [Shewanella sp. MBTL60-112-B1]GIU36481.1 YigZ family protein [Shewanella sp. MBTL60-112-B2]
MSESYLIPAAELLIEEEIKHSRFISFLFHCQSAEELKCVLTDLKIEYPGANHYCYAFVGGAPNDSINMGSSDDGEPSGSAGRPMLAALLGANIGEMGAIVIRYFGGTKLGVGGLVRAYSSGIKQAIPQLQTQLKQIRYPGELVCEYHHLKDVEHLFAQFDVLIEDKQFSDKIIIKFAIPKAAKQQLNLDLATLSKGQLKAEFEG